MRDVLRHAFFVPAVRADNGEPLVRMYTNTNGWSARPEGAEENEFAYNCV